jgi:hypothetical protein
MTRLAHIISLAFDPIIVSTLSLFIIISQVEKEASRILLWFGLIFVVGIFPPLAFLAYEKKRGRVTDWFLYNRAERIPIYVASLLSLSAALLLIWWLEGPRNLLILSLTSLLNATVLGVATYFGHKPSVHASSITFFVLILLLLVDWSYWPTIFLIPVVAWSRYKLKKHTWPQLSAGVFITLFVVLLTLRFFEFI